MESDLVSGERKIINKKALKMTSHFQSFFFRASFFTISREKPSKSSKINQESVLNL